MSKVTKEKPLRDFPVPEGIEFMKVDPRTGLIGSGSETLLECFREGTGPSPKASPPIRTTTDFFKYDFNLPAGPQ
jgi:penicillin-binding protein 1A